LRRFGSPSSKNRHKLKLDSGRRRFEPAPTTTEGIMAKGQLRSTKEAKKPKAEGKKVKKVPSYMANEVSASRPAPGKSSPKK